MLRICAVIITKDPDPGIQDRIVRLNDSVDHVILVDNGSGTSSLESIKQVEKEIGALVILNSENQGVAFALNVGAHAAKDLGYDWVLTLDQDSEPAEDMVEKLCTSYGNSVEKEKIAIIVPRIIDKGIDRESPFLRQKTKWLYERVKCQEKDLTDITTAITSGALVNLQTHQTIGEFREDFFIDYVDTEYCLRSKLRGFWILASCQAKLFHQFGSRQRIKSGPLTLYPSFHPAERWYTISRNRIPMLKEFGLKYPHWMIYELVASIFTILRMLITEDQKLDKIKGIISGTLDGLRGNMGPPPWASSDAPVIQQNDLI